jgi:hypothetical protein
MTKIVKRRRKNWQGCEMKQLVLNFRHILSICLGALMSNHKTSDYSRSPTLDLPITKQKMYAADLSTFTADQATYFPHPRCSRQ